MKILTLAVFLPAVAAAQALTPATPSPTRADTAASYTATPVSLGALGSCAALAGTFASVDSSWAEPYFCDGVDWNRVLTEKDLSADTDLLPHAVILQAGTGEYGIRALHNPLWDFGNSTTDYCQSIGGVVTCAGGWKWGSIEVETIGSTQGYTNIFSPRIFPGGSLVACGAGTEGRLGALTGASLGAQSRICGCISDGAGSPAFTWINLGCPNTAGTDTTCPACP